MRASRIEKLKVLLAQDPGDGFTRYALALEYAGMNEHTQAGALLEELIRQDPNYVPFYQQLGGGWKKRRER